MPMFSVFRHISRHLVSGDILFHRVSPSQLSSASILLPSTVICNIFLVASPLSRFARMSKPYQTLLSEEFCHRVEGGLHVCLFPHYHMIKYCLSSCPPQHAHFSCVSFPFFLLSNCQTLCYIHHGRFYSRRVHFVFQRC